MLIMDRRDVLILVLLILGISSSGYAYIQYLVVKNEVYKLNSDIDELKVELLEYIEDIEKLENDLITSNQKVNYYSTQLIKLQNDYNKLEYYYNVTEALKIGNSLTSYYDTLRYELGPTGTRSNWYSLEEPCKFAAQLALHDLHRLYWTELEARYGEDVGKASYAQAWKVMSNAYLYCGIYQEDTNIERIDKILDFINWYISYESEVDDSIRAPVETLSLRTGDCDDFTVLACALFEMADIQSAIGFFHNDEGEGHAMALIHIDDLENYKYWYFADLTELNLDEGRWLVIEPQLSIEEQGDEDWLRQWKLQMTIEIDYDKATS